MQFLNDGDQQLRIMGPEPRLLLCAKEYCKADRKESNDGKATDAAAAGAGDQLADVDGHGGKRSSRKCSEWPDKRQPSSPWTPTAARVAYVDDDECAMDGSLELPPTPPSASSTNAASSARLPLLPGPDSPVQQPSQPPATSSSPRDADLQEPAQPTPSASTCSSGTRRRRQDAWLLPFPCVVFAKDP